MKAQCSVVRVTRIQSRARATAPAGVAQPHRPDAPMYGVPKFRLKVVADLGANDTPLYVLALEELSIAGALYQLSRSLALRFTDRCLEKSEYTTLLVELLRPMATQARLLPVDVEWEAHATLRARCVEATLEEGKMDVLQLAFAVHHRLCPPEAFPAKPSNDYGTTNEEECAQAPDMFRRRAFVHAAIAEEWA